MGDRDKKFMGRPHLPLTEALVRWALDNTRSITEAAERLHVHYNTMKSRCQQYIDAETGKSLFELYKRRGSRVRGQTRTNIATILSGNAVAEPKKLFNLIVHSGLVEERCANCGFSERRIIDYKVPLRLDFIDGNMYNQKHENLRLLCFNCYFLMVGDVKGDKYDWEV